MENKFEDFVISVNEKAKKNKNGFNPAVRIEDFRKNLQSLYNKIDNDWLKNDLEKGYIKTGFEKTSIFEQLLGTYTIDEKWIQIGSERLIFSPVGTMLAGTDARVDLLYRYKEIMIVHVKDTLSNPVKYDWKYISDSNGEDSYTLLTKNSFQTLIMNLVNETCNI